MNRRKNLPRAIARAVIANMHESIVPMIYSAITPTSYVVYLHPDDFAEVEGIVAALTREINRALDEEIARLERPRWWDRLLRPTRERMPPIEPASDRIIEIAADPNGEIERGEVGVHSELRLPTAEFAGTPTVRVTSTTSVSRTTTRREVPAANGRSGAPTALLVIDDLDGRREHALVNNPTLVGRGGLGATVDVRLRTEGVVSKEHCRVRWDDQSGEFFIKDLSRNGTFVNGSRLPPGADFANGQRREIDGREVPLPHGASIALADAASLEFRRLSP